MYLRIYSIDGALYSQASISTPITIASLIGPLLATVVHVRVRSGLLPDLFVRQRIAEAYISNPFSYA